MGSIKSAVDEKSEKEIDLPEEDKFSYNLATILARDREVVAVNLRVLSNGYSHHEYVTYDREDMRNLTLTIKKYCSEKLRYILAKLRNDIIE
ncbi:hypothetical protein RhiirA4_450422 [Rhizophagus irregularis]|uniref:Uncharacterized protein n=1 Tax=Rhizophagus irregularis TaxID=588596 RepID=A0A2I1FT88_9GLOM|nr:hypothetical protein RhiirA4_450422 [Rhizophagus irregularis]